MTEIRMHCQAYRRLLVYDEHSASVCTKKAGQKVTVKRAYVCMRSRLENAANSYQLRRMTRVRTKGEQRVVHACSGDWQGFQKCYNTTKKRLRERVQCFDESNSTKGGGGPRRWDIYIYLDGGSRHGTVVNGKSDHNCQDAKNRERKTKMTMHEEAPEEEKF
ncbi:hypothetical protein BC835DRAFT_868795 [Cytidiella melzeri]|nr:hypothetical protein BC835DRAFT_868795 [Cytidiella melzeri]